MFSSWGFDCYKAGIWILEKLIITTHAPQWPKQEYILSHKSKGLNDTISSFINIIDKEQHVENSDV